LFTDVSGHFTRPIFKGQAVEEDWAERLTQNIRRKLSTCGALTLQRSDGLKYIATEASYRLSKQKLKKPKQREVYGRISF